MRLPGGWFRIRCRQIIRARGSRFSSSLPVVLSVVVFTLFDVISPKTLPADDSEKVLIRNDTVPLLPDMKIGRFGSGRLYFHDPVDLAVDEDENVYVLEAGNYRVQVISERGRYQYEWGSKGEGDGQFDEPVALAINPDSEFLVVLDQGTYRVHKYDLEGTHILSFGTEGSRKGRFEEPVDVTIDVLDYVYVLDRERKLVLKFHKSGEFIEEWGNRGHVRRRLEDPVSIAYSDELTGYIIVLDAAKGALFKYERDGDLEEIINLPASITDEGVKPLRIEVSTQEETFMLDALNGKLIKFNSYGMSVFQLTSERVVMDKPAGLTIDDENRIYVSDLKKNRVFRFPMELD